MFDSSHPPFLVLPITAQQISLFPSHEGYYTHFLSDTQAIVSYRDGWTLPLSVQQQVYITDFPLLMIRNSGGITSRSSTSDKGYAHHFCRADGQEPRYVYQHSVFPDKPDDVWRFAQDNITMIWLQYGNKNQYCGGSTFELERNYYGKLLLREFIINEVSAPRFDKTADINTTNGKLFYVASNQLCNTSWNVKDGVPEEHMQNLLKEFHLERFQTTMLTALRRASGS